MSYNINKKGYYGEFGGAYIPEMLYPNVEELRQNYLKIMAEPSFQEEFNQLLKDYVGRPSPLYFAKRLSEKYNTKVYLKREDLNHTGAHKVNNTIGQILMAKRLGKTRIIAETGAGQHGVATATVCALMGMDCIVYMGEIDIARQAPNVARMKMLGAEVRPALSGSRTLKDATNEAIRDWINNPVDTHYIIGSAIGPHPYPDMVTRFQSIISEEIKIQLKEYCENYVAERMQRITGAITDIQESLTSETKSTAGDKHETGRAMLQLEREKTGQQLAEIQNLQKLLGKIDPTLVHEKAAIGSVVYTTDKNYYISISVGEIVVDDQKFYAISGVTPMAKLLIGKSKGDKIQFRSTTFVITDIYLTACL